MLIHWPIRDTSNHKLFVENLRLSVRSLKRQCGGDEFRINIEGNVVYNYMKCMMKIGQQFHQQIPRNRLQHFVFRLHLQNPRWDWARIASATFYSRLQHRCKSKGDAVFRQTLQSSSRNPACVTLSIRGRDIIAAFIQWPYSFEALKKRFKAAPFKSLDAGLQLLNALWRYGKVWEGNRVSRSSAICIWLWTNLSSRWTCSYGYLPRGEGFNYLSLF